MPHEANSFVGHEGFPHDVQEGRRLMHAMDYIQRANGRLPGTKAVVETAAAAIQLSIVIL